jgi:hypothetical protein
MHGSPTHEVSGAYNDEAGWEVGATEVAAVLAAARRNRLERAILKETLYWLNRRLQSWGYPQS